MSTDKKKWQTMNRRELLQWAGVAMAGTVVSQMSGPLNVLSQGKANPLGTARNLVFLHLPGGNAHMDTWDFKETKFTPKDLNPKRLWPDLYFPTTLFPKLSASPILNRASFVRSMRNSDLIHSQGDYHIQAGRANNPALTREVPAFGSVIASELESQRRESDTLPTYVTVNAFGGVVGPGFLPPRFAALSFDTPQLYADTDDKGNGDETLSRRWQTLERISEVREPGAPLLEKGSEYDSYYRSAYKMLTDPRWGTLFRTTKDEKERYGVETGLRKLNDLTTALIVAKNTLKADAGARYVFVAQPDNPWDHHRRIHDITYQTMAGNIYTVANEWDQAVTAFLEDLSSMPGRAAGKSLLDETLVVATGEFGRTPEVNMEGGRDHYNKVFTSMFLGGGIKGRQVIGKSNDDASLCVDVGWKNEKQPSIDNIVATIYSALGIDWTKVIQKTPSGRAYEYVQHAPLGESGFFPTDPIVELFG